MSFCDNYELTSLFQANVILLVEIMVILAKMQTHPNEPNGFRFDEIA